MSSMSANQNPYDIRSQRELLKYQFFQDLFRQVPAGLIDVKSDVPIEFEIWGHVLASCKTVKSAKKAFYRSVEFEPGYHDPLVAVRYAATDYNPLAGSFQHLINIVRVSGTRHIAIPTTLCLICLRDISMAVTQGRRSIHLRKKL